MPGNRSDQGHQFKPIACGCTEQGLFVKRRESAKDGISCILLSFLGPGVGGRVGLGEVVKSINTGYERTAGMTKPQ